VPKYTKKGKNETKITKTIINYEIQKLLIKNIALLRGCAHGRRRVMG
jgi:hypothetical protein